MMDAQPLITNDLAGLAKLVIAIVLGTGPIYGIVIGFLRAGPNAAIKDLRDDLNGFGERVTKVEMNDAAKANTLGSLEIAMERSIQHRETLEKRQTKIEAVMENFERRETEHHREVMEGVHKVEVQLATLAAKADVGKELRDGLKEIADLMRERRRRGDHGEVE